VNASLAALNEVHPVRQLLCGLAFALASTALSPLAYAQTLLRTVPGPAVNAQFGACSIVVSDQNGDGYKDVLVGAPGFNQERGAIYCISGAFLASGVGASTVWSLAPIANQGDRFGALIVDVGDVTLDGVGDFLVGQPGYDNPGFNDAGAVRLVSGASRTAVSLIYGSAQGAAFGSAGAATGDLDGDSRTELLIGAPGGPTYSLGGVKLLRGSALSGSGPVAALQVGSISFVSGEQLGASIVSGFDSSQQGTVGVTKFAIGAPSYNGAVGVNSGAVVYGSLTWSAGFFTVERIYAGATAGERLGASLHAAHDYDGDGSVDIVAGAPNAPNGTSFQVGRAVVLSGQRLSSNQPPFEIFSAPFGSPAAPTNHADPDPNYHFGAGVRACADLNGDGVGEVLVGAPDFVSKTLSTWNYRGLVRIFSGASGAQLAQITGSTTDRLGDALGGAIGDLNGDGFKEFVLAGSRSDVGGVDSGVLMAYRLFPIAPLIYCTGKLNSLGCTPSIFSSGSPSASSSSPFLIQASNLVNQKNGLLFYSHRPNAVLFQGGTKCVAEPTTRTPPQSSGGATTGASCSGTFSFDFNDWMQNGPDLSLGAGAEIYAQYWSRDPQSPSHTSLSNALQFLVSP